MIVLFTRFPLSASFLFIDFIVAAFFAEIADEVVTPF